MFFAFSFEIGLNKLMFGLAYHDNDKTNVPHSLGYGCVHIINLYTILKI